jgi:hypothetical protein
MRHATGDEAIEALAHAPAGAAGSRGAHDMKLSKQERELIELLRDNAQDPIPPDWAVSIAYRDGVWEIFVRGMIGGTRGIGRTFLEAWNAYREADAEYFSRPPS